MTPKSIFQLVSVASVVVLSSACEKRIDEAELKATITKGFKEKLQLDVTSLNCPKELPAKEGSSFDCDVAVTGGKVPIVVKVGKDTYEFDAKHRVIDMAPVEKQLSELFGSKVDCGKDVRLDIPGAKTQCTSADGTKIGLTNTKDGWVPDSPPSAKPEAAPAPSAAASAEANGGEKEAEGEDE